MAWQPNISILFRQLYNVNKLKNEGLFVPYATLCKFPSQKVAFYRESHNLWFQPQILDTPENLIILPIIFDIL